MGWWFATHFYRSYIVNAKGRKRMTHKLMRVPYLLFSLFSYFAFPIPLYCRRITPWSPFWVGWPPFFRPRGIAVDALVWVPEKYKSFSLFLLSSTSKMMVVVTAAFCCAMAYKRMNLDVNRANDDTHKSGGLAGESDKGVGESWPLALFFLGVGA